MPTLVGLDPPGMRRLGRVLLDAEAGLRGIQVAIAQTCRSVGIPDPTAGRVVRVTSELERARLDVHRRTTVVELRLDSWSRSGLDLLLRMSAPGLGVLGVDRMSLGALPPWWGLGRVAARGYELVSPVDDAVTGSRRLRVLLETGDVRAADRIEGGWASLANRLDGVAASAAARGSGVLAELAVPLGHAARVARGAARVLPWVDVVADASDLIDPSHDGAYGGADRVVAAASLGATGVSAAAAMGLITLTPVGATVVSVVVVGAAVYTLGSMAWDAWGDDISASVRASWQRLEAGGEAALELAVEGTQTLVDAGTSIRDGVATGIELGVDWTGDRLEHLAGVADAAGDVVGDAVDALRFWD